MSETTTAGKGRFLAVRTGDNQKPAQQTESAMRTCPTCRNQFSVNPHRAVKFCSDNCRKRAWDKQQIIRTLVKALERVIEELQ